MVTYKTGYKYQLIKAYSMDTAVESANGGGIDQFIDLSAAGRLTIGDGYAWDGPSGPTFDTLNFMRGSLVHDALYQLMRAGVLDKSRHRQVADQLLRRICREDGMNALRAQAVYWAVRLAGDSAACPAARKKPMTAP